MPALSTRRPRTIRDQEVIELPTQQKNSDSDEDNFLHITGLPSVLGNYSIVL